MNPYQVLKEPVLSEKSNEVRESGNKYTFKVDLRANKNDVKKAIKALFDANVERVATVITHGKVKRRGRHLSTPKLTKKAIVTLAQGETLKMFEDQ